MSAYQCVRPIGIPRYRLDNMDISRKLERH